MLQERKCEHGKRYQVQHYHHDLGSGIACTPASQRYARIAAVSTCNAAWGGAPSKSTASMVPGTDWFQRSQKANSKVFSKINKAAIMANIDRC